MSEVPVILAMLTTAEGFVSEGRALIRRAIDLQEAAFARVPVGAFLSWSASMPEPIRDMRFTLTPDGWREYADGQLVGRVVDVEWMQEQWMRGNMTLSETAADGG